jgi:hypothetical protein
LVIDWAERPVLLSPFCFFFDYPKKGKESNDLVAYENPRLSDQRFRGKQAIVTGLHIPREPQPLAESKYQAFLRW